jgi:flagellar protein FlgJ
VIIGSASSSPAQLDAAAKDRAELREAAQAFEAIFVRRMLAAARATEFDKDGIFSGQGLEQFRAMQDEQLADIASRSGAFGLADAIERHLSAFSGGLS